MVNVKDGICNKENRINAKTTSGHKVGFLVDEISNYFDTNEDGKECVNIYLKNGVSIIINMSFIEFEKELDKIQESKSCEKFGK